MFGEFYVSRFSGREKVFDLHSESRGEGMFYGLPQTDSGLLHRIDYLTNGILQRKSFPNEIVMFRGYNLLKLPVLPKNIKVCVFNEDWLTNEDLKKFLAFNESQSGFLDMIFELYDDKHIRLSELYEFLNRAAKDKKSKEAKELKNIGAHYMNVNTIKRRARTLLRSGIFFNSLEESSSDIDNGFFHYLNLEQSLRDVHLITTFSTYLIEDEYVKFVAEAVLLKKFIELIETRQTRTPILFYIREANDYYYMKTPPPYVLEIQNGIEKILRKGRFLGGAKVTVVMDTQLLNDVPDTVFNSFNKFICFRLPIKDSEKLLRKATIPREYLIKLAMCEVGQGMYVVNGTFEYLCLFIPTLHRKADPEFDVFTYLSGTYGSIDYSKSKFLDLVLMLDKKVKGAA
jgi:hypothetical protein